MPVTVGVKLDDEIRDRLKSLGEARQRTTHWLMREAIREYLEKVTGRLSWTFAPASATPAGIPAAPTSRWILLPLRPRSVGLRPRPSPARQTACRTGACVVLPSIDCQAHSKPTSRSCELTRDPSAYGVRNLLNAIHRRGQCMSVRKRDTIAADFIGQARHGRQRLLKGG